MMLVHNFAVVPVVVFALASIAGDQALLAGVLLVLLAPCIDTSSYSRGWWSAPATASWPRRLAQDTSELTLIPICIQSTP
jgi:hypothetical protein